VDADASTLVNAGSGLAGRPGPAASREAGEDDRLGTELAAGLSRLGGRVSWFPADLRTRAPVSCYLLSEPAEALLVDSGLVVHRDAIRRGLDGSIGPSQRVNVVHTRLVEFDTVGNTAALIDGGRVATVYATFPAGDWVYFESATAGRGAGGAGQSRFEVVQPGDAVRVGCGTARERAVRVLAAPLRLLATFWLHDPLTRTLFTSDSFGHVTLGHTGGRALLRSGAPDHTTLDDVRRHLVAKFAWLAEADVAPLQAELAAIFDGHRIDNLAPTFGCPIVGAAAVARHYGLVQQALSEIADPSRRPFRHG
jgi:hypothetical protein